jgi:hypothetical protein
MLGHLHPRGLDQQSVRRERGRSGGNGTREER